MLLSLPSIRLNYWQTQLLNPHGILKNATIVVPLKFLSIFCWSLQMPLINWKVELKFKWTKYSVLAAAGGDNTNSNLYNFIFTIKDTKLNVPAVILSVKVDQKQSKFFSKGFEMSIDIFSSQTLLELTDFLFWFIQIKITVLKVLRLLLIKKVLQKIITWSSIINFYNQPVYSDIKQYKKITKLTAGQGEDDTTECFYEYIKNCYRLIANDLSREKELETNSKAIQKIEFVGQLKNTENADNTIYVCFNQFRKNQRKNTKIFSRKSNSLIKDGKLWRSKS